MLVSLVSSLVNRKKFKEGLKMVGFGLWGADHVSEVGLTIAIVCICKL
jgi:hypothetical protein